MGGKTDTQLRREKMKKNKTVAISTQKKLDTETAEEQA
tara:strand:+ start:429 stop:542 length:114 start_codon:yes stop_codon:yes gene_type:complete